MSVAAQASSWDDAKPQPSAGIRGSRGEACHWSSGTRLSDKAFKRQDMAVIVWCERYFKLQAFQHGTWYNAHRDSHTDPAAGPRCGIHSDLHVHRRLAVHAAVLDVHTSQSHWAQLHSNSSCHSLVTLLHSVPHCMSTDWICSMQANPRTSVRCLVTVTFYLPNECPAASITSCTNLTS